MALAYHVLRGKQWDRCIGDGKNQILFGGVIKCVHGFTLFRRQCIKSSLKTGIKHKILSRKEVLYHV